jgi:hypothetical protein
MQLSEIITLTRNLLNDNVNYSTSSPGIESAQSFSPDMYTDAVNWACKQYALKTQATYTEVGVVAATADSTLAVPTDNLDIIRVLTNGNIPASPTVYTLAWDVPGTIPSPDGTVTTLFTSSITPAGFPTPVTYAWTVGPSSHGTVTFGAVNQESITITYALQTFGDLMPVGLNATVPGYSPSILSATVTFI